MIGLTFADELAAAGLGDVPISWDAETGVVSGWEHLTAQQNTALNTVIAVHDPTVKPVPASIEAWRVKAQLQMDGILTAVDNAVRANASPEAVAAWDAGAPIARSSPAVNQIADKLGLDLDDLLRRAATVTL